MHRKKLLNLEYLLNNSVISKSIKLCLCSLKQCGLMVRTPKVPRSKPGQQWGAGRLSGGRWRGAVGGTGGRQWVKRVGGVGDVGAGNHLLLHPLDDAGQVSGVLS